MSAAVAVAENIWIFEGTIVPFFSCPYPTRCVVVRLPSGKLWVWSPIYLTPPLKAQIDDLGKPAHLVSPNKIHHLFLQDWSAAWPEAKLWGPQSTIDKRTDLSFEDALDKASPEAWEGVIDLVRFSGSPVMDKVVFFHRPSKTAILADLSEHFSEDFLMEHWKPWQRWIARVWGIVEGKGYAPLEWRLTFFNRKKARAAKSDIRDWDPEKVIMAHGVWQSGNGRAYLEKALSWV
ncbi:MAG: DUF4336 domain-containing protein [Roseibium sp.]